MAASLYSFGYISPIEYFAQRRLAITSRCSCLPEKTLANRGSPNDSLNNEFHITSPTISPTKSPRTPKDSQGRRVARLHYAN
jgi:hypothetical protein